MNPDDDDDNHHDDQNVALLSLPNTSTQELFDTDWVIYGLR